MAINENANLNLTMTGLPELKRQFKEIGDAMTAAGKAGDTELFNKLKLQAAGIKDQMGDLKKEMASLEPDAMIKNFARLGSSLVAAFSAGSAAAVLFGVNEKKAQEITKNAMIAVQLLQAAEVLRVTLVEEGTVKIIAAKVKEAAAWALANPVMAISIAAIAALGVGIYELNKAINSETEAEKANRIEKENINTIQEKAIEKYAESTAEITLSVAVLLNEKTALVDKKNALIALDKQMGTTLSNEKDINKAIKEGLILSKLKLASLKAEAEAEAAKDLYTESFKKKLQEQQKTTSEYVTFWSTLINTTSGNFDQIATDAKDAQQEALLTAQSTANQSLGLAYTFQKVADDTEAQFKAMAKSMGVLADDTKEKIKSITELPEYTSLKSLKPLESLKSGLIEVADIVLPDAYGKMNDATNDWLLQQKQAGFTWEKDRIDNLDAVKNATRDFSTLIMGMQDLETANSDKNQERQKQIKKRYAILNLGLTIAETYSNIAGAVAKAQLDPGFPLSIAETIRIVALGASSLGTIFSQISAIQRLNKGGIVGGIGDYDTQPAMLTPGEFVVNKNATQKFLPELMNMNSGKSSLAKEIGMEMQKNLFIVNNVQQTSNMNNRVNRVKNRAILK